MSHKKLTVVIAFLNESEEVKNTIGSVREWVGDKVDIVVVNDCSDDGYNYDADLKPIDIAYYINPNRMGAARSKEFGISKIKTPYFLLLDAHMRFYDSAWLEILVNTLDQNDRQILCCQTKVLKKSGKRVFEPLEEKFSSKIRSGSFVKFEKIPDILEPEWIHVENDYSTITTEMIPCIYGAAYCASKRYWDYLKGYKGLLGFGLEEPYISMKAYMEGGNCLLMKNIVVGHIYRTKFPYRVNGLEYVYNKLMIADMFLPNELKNYIRNHCQQSMKKDYQQVLELLDRQKEELAELKEYYNTIFTRSFLDFYEYNMK